MNPHHANKLLDMVLEMKDDVADIKSIVKANTVVLEEHEKRSTASEKRHELNEFRLEEMEKRVYLYDSVFKILVALTGVVGTVLGIIYTIHQLR